VKDGVFLDSGIFIAFLNRRDRWHAQAVALFTGARPRWCTSLLVFSECYSWFLHKMGEEPARTFRRLVGSLDGLRLFEPTQDLHEATLSTLDRFRGSKLTYVDACSLTLMERHGIDCVWATDHHLSLAGAHVLPRS
jgi:predicted nucleic acid-binding protein